MKKQDSNVKFKRAERGFTILEMLLVIAFITLMVGLGGGIYVGT